MQRCERFCTGRMDIAKHQHVFEAIFAPNLVPAPTLERLRVFESTEQNVPNRNVCEIVCVMMKLMMDTVGFRPLEDETEP